MKSSGLAPFRTQRRDWAMLADMSVKTILVVEDDKGVQGLLKDALEGAGFQVSVEKDGEWALRALERRLPDLVITDLLLPGISGFELLDRLRAMPGGDEVPVIVVSGIYRGTRHRLKARERFGVVAYLEKPFDVTALMGAARDALGDPGMQTTPHRVRPSTQTKELGDDPLADFDTRLERDEVDRVESSFRPDSLAVRGNLRHKRFAEVASQLYRRRATGALLLRRGRIKKIVYFKDGFPIFVKSNLLSECLGRILVRERMITEEECARSLEITAPHSGRQQGAILIEMGAISPHNLVFGLQLQLQQKLFDIFGWPDGDYQYNEKIDVPTQAVHLDMSMASLVYEGVRRKVGEQQVRDLLEPFLELPLTGHPDPLHRFQEMSLEGDERNLVALIDGNRSTRELVALTRLPQKNALQLIYALIAAELVQPSMRPSGGPPPPLPRRSERREAPPQRAREGEGGSAPVGLGPLTMLSRAHPSEVPASLFSTMALEELRDELVVRSRRSSRMNAFEVLGVSRQAEQEEIERAYATQTADLGPERLRRPGDALPADVRALADQLRGQLTAAYEALGDSRRRQEYAERLTLGVRSGTAEDTHRLLRAEAAQRRADLALQAERYEDAVRAFQEAAELVPDEPLFQVGWSWSRFQQGPDDPLIQAEAIAGLERVTQQAPRFDRGWLTLARVLQRAGRGGEALRHFETALHCNPDCREAQDELRSWEGRRRG